MCCYPDSCLEDYPFDMLVQSINSWKMIYVYSQQKKSVAIHFNLGDILNGVSTAAEHFSIRNDTSHINVQNDHLPLKLNENELSDPRNA